MVKLLGRKQSATNEQWLSTIKNIENIIAKEEVDQISAETVAVIKQKVAHKKAAYAWSGGKDSMVLAHICHQAGIIDNMIGICNLEYPTFVAWIEEHKTSDCTVINTGQDLKWLSKHQDMLFPQNSMKAAQWFSAVQHKAQRQYYQDKRLDMILLGRRKADGNYVGKKDNIYTDSKGITRYSPLSHWSHEQILGYIHYHQLPLPPIYQWKNGYLCGTHAWAARQWTGSIENGWHEIYQIDADIVKEAACYIQSAERFLKGVVANESD